MSVHHCPVCGTLHDVHPVLDRLAYGRQLTCSPRCKTIFPGMVRQRVLAEIAALRRLVVPSSGNAANAGVAGKAQILDDRSDNAAQGREWEMQHGN
ncbi:hypothetical protein [Azonexus sp. R2A61]|uniref:hypothetical protein n=1 Tax=Azonexus sp. R2A61 TaxID=2744443 RepID=UPI001F3320BF|nr:hypothetical protein [Azonexus sp. R2A61]